MLFWQPNVAPDDPPTWFRSLALIPDGDSSRNTRWLSVWDENRNCFDFITAERRGNESFRDCIHREVLAALDLTKRDVLVSKMAQLNLEFIDSVPESAIDLHIAISFYVVHLYSRAAQVAVQEMVESRWLTGRELLQGETKDGWHVNPRLSYLLQRADVIPAW